MESGAATPYDTRCVRAPYRPPGRVRHLSPGRGPESHSDVSFVTGRLEMCKPRQCGHQLQMRLWSRMWLAGGRLARLPSPCRRVFPIPTSPDPRPSDPSRMQRGPTVPVSYIDRGGPGLEEGGGGGVGVSSRHQGRELESLCACLRVRVPACA